MPYTHCYMVPTPEYHQRVIADLIKTTWSNCHWNFVFLKRKEIFLKEYSTGIAWSIQDFVDCLRIAHLGIFAKFAIFSDVRRRS